jgi:hypothetical protein
MAAIESNQRSAGLKNPTLPFRGVEQEYPRNFQNEKECVQLHEKYLLRLYLLNYNTSFKYL